MTIVSTVRTAARRFGIDFSRYRDPYNLAIYNRLIDHETLKRRPFINVGSGSFWHPYWQNVDFVTDHYRSVQRDITPFNLMDTKPLPFANESLKIVYTSHTIEHVKNEAGQRFFNEAFRTLESGGIFRITTGPTQRPIIAR